MPAAGLHEFINPCHKMMLKIVLPDVCVFNVTHVNYLERCEDPSSPGWPPGRLVPWTPIHGVGIAPSSTL